MKSKALGRSLLLTLTFLWATSFPSIKIVVGSIGFNYYVALRFTLASIPMLLYAALKADNTLLRRNLKPGLILGILFLGGISLQGFGMEYTSASNAAFITGLSIVFVYVIEVLFGRERFTLRLTLAVFFASTGMYLLSLQDGFTLNLGDLIVLGGSLFWALQIVSVGVYTRNHDLTYLLFYEILFTAFGGVLLLPLTPPPQRILAETLFYTVYLSIACTVVANALQLYGQRIVPNVEAAFIYLMEPVFASILSYLILGETMGVKEVAGASLIIAAIGLSSYKPR